MDGLGTILLTSVQRAPWGWGVLIVALVALIKSWPALKNLTISEHQLMRQEYIDQIRAFRDEVQSLRAKVDTLTAENAELKVQIAGMRSQHLSEQAAAIRNIPSIREAVQEVAKEGQHGQAQRSQPSKAEASRS